jgi:hypothetical protein
LFPSLKSTAEIEAELTIVKSQLAKSQESLIFAGADTKAALEKPAAEQAAHPRALPRAPPLA